VQDRINLDVYFRKESAARTIAERLLTGSPQTRQELTDGLGVSVTTVNRVVEILTEAGAKVVRDVADDGRQARFRIVDVQAPKATTRFPTLDEEVEIIGAWKVGNATMIDLASDKSQYRGQLKSLSKMIPLGKRGRITGIRSIDDGLAEFRIKTDDKELTVDAVRNVTASD
jgi:biotin operon repressor